MKIKTILSTLIAVICLNGCSVYKALSQPGAAELTGIGPGTSREELISKLGAPKSIDTDKNGRKQDVFEFQSGMHQASKIRALPYLAADVFTLTLAELVLWPLELTALESATCTGIATYNPSLKIETWSVTRKKDSSAQDC